MLAAATFAAEGTRFQEEDAGLLDADGGDPRTVQARIEELAEHTAADEIMVTTNVYEHAEGLRPYERLAGVFEHVR